MNELVTTRAHGENKSPTQSSTPGGRDLSELQLLRTEIEALRRQNAIMRETLDTIEGSVVVYDPERRYLLGNQAYHALYPHLPPEHGLIARRYEELLRASIAAGSVDNPLAYTDTEAFVAARIADMERRRSLSTEAHNSRPGRESLHPQTGHWSLVRSRRTPSGNDVSLRVDITAQKRLQQELEEARSVAEKASQMKSRFLGNISHELRTPLNAVINFARLLTDEIHGSLGAPQYREYAADIAESGVHLLTLIDELLDLARAEAGKLTLIESVMDIGRVIAGVCRVLRPEAAKAGVTLANDSTVDAWRMRGDPTRVRQVLFNLVGNALKFTPSGGTVRISTASEIDGGLRILVKDTGVGISAQDLERVMEPFVQVARPSSKSRPGVGLGLPMSRYLIELHGGTLALTSVPRIGTTAEIRLPAERMFERAPALSPAVCFDARWPCHFRTANPGSPRRTIPRTCRSISPTASPGSDDNSWDWC